MRIGYGYRRSEREFERANVERIWIDHKGTERLERTDLLRNGVRPGDVLVLLARGDLGWGGEIPMIRAELQRQGVSVEVIEPEKTERAAPGRKPMFIPDDAGRARRLWKDTRYAGSYALKETREITGYEGDDTQLRNALNHAFGARSKKERFWRSESEPSTDA